MAGVQWKGGKLHGAGEFKAQLRHSFKDQRLIHGHSNEDIQKELTATNTSIYGLTYNDACSVYGERVGGYMEQYTAEHGRSMRKDTVTAIDLVITTPKDLPRDTETENLWFADVAEIINDYYGTHPLIDGAIHRDEVHEYYNPDTKSMELSRTHGHFFTLPFVLDKDGNEKLNGKEFSARKNIMAINKAIDDMSWEKYHVRFMDGSGKKNGKTVEQMKQESKSELAKVKAEVEQKKLDSLKEENKEYEPIVARNKAIIDDTVKAVEEAKKLVSGKSLKDFKQGKPVKERAIIDHKETVIVDGYDSSHTEYQPIYGTVKKPTRIVKEEDLQTLINGVRLTDGNTLKELSKQMETNTIKELQKRAVKGIGRTWQKMVRKVRALEKSLAERDETIKKKDKELAQEKSASKTYQRIIEEHFHTPLQDALQALYREDRERSEKREKEQQEQFERDIKTISRVHHEAPPQSSRDNKTRNRNGGRRQ